MHTHRRAAARVALIAMITSSAAAVAPGAQPGAYQPPESVGVAPPVGRVEQAPSRPLGYYRQPAIHGDTIVFVAEGDLWKVSARGGAATRLTSHPGDESQPAISPDGQRVAFVARYEGPAEVYVMPIGGGLPTRLTWDAASCSVSGWTPSGHVIAATDAFSTLPAMQLTTINPDTGARTRIELAESADGCFDGSGRELFFTRLPSQGSRTKRYKGGSVQTLWRFTPGAAGGGGGGGGGAEATPLSADFTGTSKRAMWWNGRVYFLTDRDGAMNVWSMSDRAGVGDAPADLRQHTQHKGLDAAGGSLSNGKIAFQLGADIWVLDTSTGQTAAVPITLESDLDQMRERWHERPLEFVTSAHLSPDGDRVAIVARGRVFVAPARQHRLVDVVRDDAVRYRGARFMPGEDGSTTLVALSDRSGEVELWTLPANGVGEPVQLTTDGTVLRWDAVPSPDGKYIAHHDKNQQLWLYDVEKKSSARIDLNGIDGFRELAWSGDSRWLAYVTEAPNMYSIIRLYSVESGQATTITSDRFYSYSPAWSRDGQWLYFLSDRTLRTVVGSPWGPYQPDPMLDETTKIYALALTGKERWPWQPHDELMKKKDDEAKDAKAGKDDQKDAEKTDVGGEAKPVAPTDPEPKPDEPKPSAKPEDHAKSNDKPDDKARKAPKKVEIVLEGLADRLYEVPLPAGNYDNLAAAEKALFYTVTPRAFERKTTLMGVEIKNEFVEPKAVTSDLTAFELSADGKKILLRKRDGLWIIDAAASPASDLDKKAVNLAGWSLPVVPRVQWRQMFIDSWRLMRDYFYDPKMHGVNWRAMLDKYLPLVDRVATRAELSDLIAQMVAELSALHTFVYGGDLREPPQSIAVATLGAILERDEAAGGWRIVRIFEGEPGQLGSVSPLARPDVNARPGDIIEMIDGTPTLSVPHYAALLRAKAGRQVLVRIRPAQGAPDGGGFGASRDAIVVPISQSADDDLRLTDWEVSRRRQVESASDNRIGYVHLRAMNGGDYGRFAANYYPVFNREGLIMDLRDNGGGNTDSWILGKLMRKAWFYWHGRVGNAPAWNMQYAFRGHMVVLCDAGTGSDGEAFTEGFRRLGLGKVIGTRTWGGEIWLSSSNVLVDRGIATAAETGVYGPEGAWLIEGHGVDPDMVVDNLPHETFKGRDAQLEAAIAHLQQLMKDRPVSPVNPPAKPDKSFDNR